MTLLIITLKKQSFQTSSTPILRCTEEIDLGVVFDTKLPFGNHISMSIDKANRLLGITRKSFCALDNTSLDLLYKAIVRPHLEYMLSLSGIHTKRVALTAWKMHNAGLPNIFKTFHI